MKKELTLEEVKDWWEFNKEGFYSFWGKEAMDNHVNELVRYFDVPAEEARKVFGDIIKDE